MTGIEHRACYGEMFPNFRHAAGAWKTDGKVFHLSVVGPSGMLPPARHVEMDRDAWDECYRCPDFDSCYKLSMARLALQTAVGEV